MSISDKLYKADGKKPPDINKSCTKEKTPSETNPRCQEFEKVMGKSKMPKTGEAIMIVYDKKKNSSTRCYGPSKNNAGWCGTCHLTAKPSKTFIIMNANNN